MKRRRLTEEQIIAVLQENEAGAKAADLCRKYGLSEATVYNWRSMQKAARISVKGHSADRSFLLW